MGKLRRSAGVCKRHSYGQRNLGFLYQNGEGVLQDLAEAADWYRKAADQADATAQNNLGLLYLNGRGVTQNDTEALKWFRKAAEQGEVVSQVILGNLYNTGKLNRLKFS